MMESIWEDEAGSSGGFEEMRVTRAGGTFDPAGVGTMCSVSTAAPRTCFWSGQAPWLSDHLTLMLSPSGSAGQALASSYCIFSPVAPAQVRPCGHFFLYQVTVVSSPGGEARGPLAESAGMAVSSGHHKCTLNNYFLLAASEAQK